MWDSHKARKSKNKKAGKGFGYSIKSSNDEYTNTISARYYKDGAEILIKRRNHDIPRKLTPDEARQLQGFPNDFILNKSDIQAYKQFGNAVSVPVIKFLSKELLKYL